MPSVLWEREEIAAIVPQTPPSFSIIWIEPYVNGCGATRRADCMAPCWAMLPMYSPYVRNSPLSRKATQRSSHSRRGWRSVTSIVSVGQGAVSGYRGHLRFA